MGKRAVPRAEIRRAWREKRGRNQRAERGALAGKTDLPARPRERVRPRRREKLLPASLRLKNRLLLPIRARSSRWRAAVSPLPPLVLHRAGHEPLRLPLPSSPSARHAAVSPPPLFLFHYIYREREREVGEGGGNGREETKRWAEAEAAAAAQCKRDRER
jgi:hypothetical protein